MNNKVIKIELYRYISRIDIFDPQRVMGKLIIFYENKKQEPRMYSTSVLENRAYVFPEGIYKIKKEFSPKFKKRLWEFKDIPNRTEIKFHSGVNSMDSKGCPLLHNLSLFRFEQILDDSKEYYINITDM